MSNLFGMSGGRTAATTSTKALGIDLQGSQYGPPVPVGYGQNKVSGNVIDYWGFKSLAHTQSVGKGGSQSSTSYTYQASYLNGLCEGPVTGIVQVWSGTSVVLLSTLAPYSATGAVGQAPWSQLPSGHSLGYSGTALFGVSDMALGGSATLPNYNYEIQWPTQYGSGILDANPSVILNDLCTNAQYGLGFNYLSSLTQYSNYCVANGLFLSPVYEQQASGVQILTDLFKATNTYAYFSEGVLKVVPLGDVAVTGNGVTYTPNVTPVVNLGASDFIVSGSSSPVTVQRKAPQDAYNAISLQFSDRANTYHNSAVVASIDEDMIANGARASQTANINGCTTASVARFIAQNMVQRAYYVRNQYRFKLGWRYCYLEPTDIVTLTDVNTGLNLFPVRILEVAEDATGLLNITAEEFPEGIGHSALYGTQSGGQSPVDPSSDPGPVNPPFLFRGPGFLVPPGAPEIWCAVNGSGALWAAADIYLSHDGTTYTYVGTTAAPSRYGALTTTLPLGTDPDTTNTPSVDLYAPAILLGGSQADADNFNTKCIIDGEVISYETATLTGTETYALSYLRRGGYGTAIASHNVGAPFARLDDAIYRIPVDPSMIGETIYLKFLSLNSFGRTPRTLAGETAYTYVIGTNVELPDVPPPPQNFAAGSFANTVSITWTNPNPAAVGCTSIEWSTASGGPFTVLADVGPTTTAYALHDPGGTQYFFRARARGPLVVSGWSAYTAVVQSAAEQTPSPTSGLNALFNPSFESNLITPVNTVSNAVGDIVSDGWTLNYIDQISGTPVWSVENSTSAAHAGLVGLAFTLTPGLLLPSGAVNWEITIQSRLMLNSSTGAFDMSGWYKTVAAAANPSDFPTDTFIQMHLGVLSYTDQNPATTGTDNTTSYVDIGGVTISPANPTTWTQFTPNGSGGSPNPVVIPPVESFVRVVLRVLVGNVSGASWTTPAIGSPILYLDDLAGFFPTDLSTQVTGVLPVGSLPSTVIVNPMTTDGDTIYGAAAGALTRLPIGTSLQSYRVVSGIPDWYGMVVNSQSGTSYTLGLSDLENTVTMNNSAANVVNIPPYSSVAAPVGARVRVIGLGTGQTSFSPSTGVTLSSPGLFTIASQYGTVELENIGVDNWILSQDVTAGSPTTETGGVASYESTVLALNPVLFYMLNDTSGTTATNLGSLGSANATYTGGYTLNTTSGNTGITKCVALNGTSGYLVTGAINPYGTATAVSNEIWVNPASIGTLSRLCDIYNRLSLQLETSGTVTAIMNGANALNTGTAIAHGTKLIHLVWVADSTGQEWFINGVSVATTTTPYSNSAPTGGYYIGQYSGGGYSFGGNVGPHAVYQSRLTSAQVLANYNAGK